MSEFVLASASPRRRELLLAAGFRFDVEAVDVDESRLPDEPAPLYVERVARSKAATAARRHPGRMVLAADTAVVVDGDVLGKPRDDGDAAEMLARLSGRAHEVLTGVMLARGGRAYALVERTVVWVAVLTPRAIADYVASGEPRGKAGAYAIQGLASRFIPRIDGSYTNVVGLPVEAVARLLDRFGAARTTVAVGGPRDLS